MKAYAILLISSILLFCLLRVVTDPADVKVSVDNPVHNLDTKINYTSIQDAINANETLCSATTTMRLTAVFANVLVSPLFKS